MPEKHEIIIVGAGLSGLSAAHFLSKSMPEIDILILEQDSRPGGAVRSFNEQGYLAEWGPHGFLDNNPASRALLSETGLDRIAQKAPLNSFVRFVCHQGQLVQLPQSPPALLATSLLSPLGKLRLLGEFFKKPLAKEQNVGQWAAYRFGPEILPLVDAAITGTFAGDYNRLSIDAVMPGVRALEKEAGSVLKGLLRKKRKPGALLPAMTSFPLGMEQLITTLSTGANILYHSPVREISRKNQVWEISTETRTYRAASVILALPVNRSLELLATHAPPLSAIPTARIATVALGFTDKAQVPFGFGYLSPEREERFAMGALFSTNMFPGRAPAGRVLMEALVGGRRHPERLELSDEELLSRVYDDLRKLIPLPEPPCFSRVLRGNSSIPQLEIGYPALLTWKDALEQDLNGLHLCGFGWEGIGMNDMIQTSRIVADRILRRAGGKRQNPEVKPVYF
ncbi:MAG TPA: protoporphyrinogen oxidase [Desulfobulbaceae bacterium]|nr:MAG: protoporphyrinogen oxidase [Deltaproteobacteria bacterium RIFOXYD12_FULL_53_23]HCC55521.1 protoporphyrinogen oxidase [Desulfobulbaceae bacterium]